MKIEASPEEVTSILNQYKTTIQSKASTGELVFEDVPVIFARAEFMSTIYSELEELVGASASGVLKRIGKAYGEKFYELLINDQESNIFGDRQKLFSYLCAETQAIGWGRISIEEFPGKIIIRSEKGLATGRNYVGKSEQPVDSYFLGYFEGFFSKLDNIVYHGIESECIAAGNSCCKLEFGTEPVF